jgi:signal transduction histidine kinase
VSSAPEPKKSGVASFRAKLAAAIMLVVFVLTGLSFYLAQRHVAAEARRDLQQDFQAELQSLHQVQNLRNAALTERCRVLVAKPRIHAALEDNAVDLLYPTAKDELRDLMQGDEPSGEEAGRVLHARFYRFLDNNGAVLHPPNPKDVGELSAETESALALKNLLSSQQIGYLSRATPAGEIIDEVLVAPIFSSETGEVISALVVGFKPLEVPGRRGDRSLTSGIWAKGRLQMSSLPLTVQASVAAKIDNALAHSSPVEGNFTISIEDIPHLLFYKRLNPDSVFPPAYEVYVYPLAHYDAWQRRLRWQIGFVGLALLIIGFIASHLIAARLSVPVEKLELVSEQHRAERNRAEAALESTSEELQRTARYSADASHQLKSPVTVLRAGLETLLTRDDFKPEVYDELSILLHQTYRLTGVIDDLLLLARMDAGRLQLESQPVNLGELIEEWLDDMSAMPDSIDLQTEKQLPPDLYIAGERRYTSLIVQNLLENARKYNRPGGKIDIFARRDSGSVILTIGNTGRAIPRGAQENLFERFQRGASHQNISGHGLGLNLARELARLHGGDLRLVRSEGDWTEFEVRFRAAQPMVRSAVA